MKVLLVDDHETTLRLQSMVFQHAGWETVSVADAPTAIAHIAQESPDLVVLDLSMPGMDGLEVLVRLRLHHACRVLVLSGFQRERLWPVVQRLGASAYVQKGADVNEILHTANEVMAAPMPPLTPMEGLRSRMDELI